MNTTVNLQHFTTPFEDYLLKDLADSEFAKGYFEAARHDFNKDGNIEALRLSLKNIADAQDGVQRLIAWTTLSPQDITYLVTTPLLQLDKVLDILSKLKGSSDDPKTP